VNGNTVFRLVILQGSDQGKRIDLEAGREYLVGRAEECDIRIDISDKTVSRKHAQLNIKDKHVVIESLNATNPVLIKGKPVTKSTLKVKGQFRIGESLFAVEKIGMPAGTAKSATDNSPFPLRIVLIGALVIICIGLVVIVMSGSKQPDVPVTGMTRPAAPDTLPPIKTVFPETKKNTSGLSNLGLAVSHEDRKKADQRFRQGMFFYDTGNLFRAVDEWNRAVILNPDHPDAQTWFLKAEKELEEKVKIHFQNAMIHYKYMRYDDAAHEFRLVVELSRDKNSDQYINALKSLNEIQGR